MTAMNSVRPQFLTVFQAGRAAGNNRRERKDRQAEHIRNVLRQRADNAPNLGSLNTDGPENCFEPDFAVSRPRNAEETELKALKG